MKTDIHPTYFPKAKISCACGNELIVVATKEHISVEICGACHPFYTGKEKLIDTAGRVEKFKTRLSKAGTTAKKKAAAPKTMGRKARK